MVFLKSGFLHFFSIFFVIFVGTIPVGINAASRNSVSSVQRYTDQCRLCNECTSFKGVDLFCKHHYHVDCARVLADAQLPCVQCGKTISPSALREIISNETIETAERKEQVNYDRDDRKRSYQDNSSSSSKSLCTICMETELTPDTHVIIAPCTHKGICKQCYDTIKASTKPCCPECREAITGYIKWTPLPPAGSSSSTSSSSTLSSVSNTGSLRCNNANALSLENASLRVQTGIGALNQVLPRNNQLVEMMGQNLNGLYRAHNILVNTQNTPSTIKTYEPISIKALCMMGLYAFAKFQAKKGMPLSKPVQAVMAAAGVIGTGLIARDFVRLYNQLSVAQRKKCIQYGTFLLLTGGGASLAVTVAQRRAIAGFGK